MELTDIITQIKNTNEALTAFGEHLEDEKIRPSLYRHYMALKDEFFAFFDNVEMMGEQLKKMQMTAQEVQIQVVSELLSELDYAHNGATKFWFEFFEKYKEFNLDQATTMGTFLYAVTKDEDKPMLAGEPNSYFYIWKLVVADLRNRANGKDNILKEYVDKKRTKA